MFRQLRRLLKVRVWRSYTFKELAVAVVLLCTLGGLFLGGHFFQVCLADTLPLVRRLATLFMDSSLEPPKLVA